MNYKTRNSRKRTQKMTHKKFERMQWKQGLLEAIRELERGEGTLYETFEDFIKTLWEDCKPPSKSPENRYRWYRNSRLIGKRMVKIRDRFYYKKYD